jgi:hypothetical protein
VALGFSGLRKACLGQIATGKVYLFLESRVRRLQHIFRDRRPHFASRAVVLPLLAGGALIYTLIA